MFHLEAGRLDKLYSLIQVHVDRLGHADDPSGPKTWEQSELVDFALFVCLSVRLSARPLVCLFDSHTVIDGHHGGLQLLFLLLLRPIEPKPSRGFGGSARPFGSPLNEFPETSSVLTTNVMDQDDDHGRAAADQAARIYLCTPSDA